MDPEVRSDWSQDETRLLVRAMRTPRGRYPVTRASQLAGVPERTLYDWAKSGVVVPDYAHARPKQWSYRDLVFLRMTAWLRSQGMTRSTVVDRVAWFRGEFTRMSDADVFEVIRSDGRSIMWGDETVDRFTGQMLLDRSFLSFLHEFELIVPEEVEELGSKRLWGPNLMTPAPRVRIDPWVMGGEPCVLDTRIPTSTLHALQVDRGLSPAAIVALYPDSIDESDVLVAGQLERALRTRTKLAA